MLVREGNADASTNTNESEETNNNPQDLWRRAQAWRCIGKCEGIRTTHLRLLPVSELYFSCHWYGSAGASMLRYVDDMGPPDAARLCAESAPVNSMYAPREEESIALCVGAVAWFDSERVLG